MIWSIVRVLIVVWVGVVGFHHWTLKEFAPQECAGAVPSAVTEDDLLTVTDVGREIGGFLHTLNTSPPSPAEVRQVTVESAAILGVFARSVKDGAAGVESERVATYEAQVVNASMEVPGLSREVQVAWDAAEAAGFTGEDLTIAVAVAGAESAYDPAAANFSNADGSVDYGMWQINSVHQDVLNGGYWKDPQDNAVMAYKVWERAGGSWEPWVTYNSGAYLEFMPGQTCAPAESTGVVMAGFPGGEPGPWGGHENGQIPSPALCPVRGGGEARCDAAQAFDRMSTAYRDRFGTLIAVTDTYRDYAGQVSCRQRKGDLCAKPGTSNHGWGLAFDLGGGIQRFGTPQHEWMRENGPRFGFVHPEWAQRGGSKPEPWHWEFSPVVRAG